MIQKYKDKVEIIAGDRVKMTLTLPGWEKMLNDFNGDESKLNSTMCNHIARLIEVREELKQDLPKIEVNQTEIQEAKEILIFDNIVGVVNQYSEELANVIGMREFLNTIGKTSSLSHKLLEYNFDKASANLTEKEKIEMKNQIHSAVQNVTDEKAVEYAKKNKLEMEDSYREYLHKRYNPEPRFGEISLEYVS